MFSTRTIGTTLGALAVLASAACSGATAYRGAAAPTPAAARRGPDVSLRTIGPRTLAADPGRSLYDVVTMYWPNVLNPPWAMRRSSGTEIDQLGVYANGALAGSLEHFRGVSAARIASVRRLTPTEEFMTFGRQHAAGALVVEWVKD